MFLDVFGCFWFHKLRKLMHFTISKSSFHFFSSHDCRLVLELVQTYAFHGTLLIFQEQAQVCVFGLRISPMMLSHVVLEKKY